MHFFAVEFFLLYTVGILIFIEIIKELPLASLLLPPNFKTLAFEIDRYASDEQLAMTAAPSFLVIGLCFILLSIFHKIQKKEENR